MPFPRAKANVYDDGARVPLVIRWPGVSRAGHRHRVVRQPHRSGAHDSGRRGADGARRDDRTQPAAAPARRIAARRDRVFIERERHANVRQGDLSYPVRAIRTNDYLYIRNFRPDRWPAGDPEQYVAVGPFGDIDGGPSKSVVLDRRTESTIEPYLPARHRQASGRGAVRLEARSAPDRKRRRASRAPCRAAAPPRGFGSLDARDRRPARDRGRRPLGSIPVLRRAGEVAVRAGTEEMVNTLRALLTPGLTCVDARHSQLFGARAGLTACATVPDTSELRL